MKNPYTWTKPTPELFYGHERRDLAMEMCRSLGGTKGHPLTSYSLIGGRRMGKTTMLRYIESNLREDVQEEASHWLVVPVYLDGLSFPHSAQPSDIWVAIHQSVVSALPNLTHAGPPPRDFDSFKQSIEAVLTQSTSFVRIVTLFDEIEQLVDYVWTDTFLNNLRTLISNAGELSDHFSFVFAGAQELYNLQDDWTSPLHNVLTPRYLRVLDFEDCRLLMKEPVNYYNWSTAFLRQAYQESGGQPMFLQYLMQKVCGLSFEIGENALSEAVRMFEQEQSRQLFPGWVDRYFSSELMKVYEALNDDGSYVSRSELNQRLRSIPLGTVGDALITLDYMGLIVIENDGLGVRYAGELFRRWYNQYVESSAAETPIAPETGTKQEPYHETLVPTDVDVKALRSKTGHAQENSSEISGIDTIQAGANFESETVMLEESEVQLQELQAKSERYRRLSAIENGIIVLVIGILAIFTGPDYLQWSWLENHPHRLGLQLSAVLFLLGVLWSVLDWNNERKRLAFGSLVIATVLVALQIV